MSNDTYNYSLDSLTETLEGAGTPEVSFSGLFADLSGVRDAGVTTLLPEELDYHFQIIECEPGMTQKGDQKLNVVNQVIAPAEFKGVKVKDQVIFKVQERFKSFLKGTQALSEAGSFAGQGPGDFVGRVFKSKVKTEEYKERKYNKIAFAFSEPDAEFADYNLPL